MTLIFVQLRADKSNENVAFTENAWLISAIGAEICSINSDLGLSDSSGLHDAGADYLIGVHSIASQHARLLSSCPAHHDAV